MTNSQQKYLIFLSRCMDLNAIIGFNMKRLTIKKVGTTKRLSRQNVFVLLLVSKKK